MISTIRTTRLASLVLSLFLQVAPLVRVAVADAAAVFTPIAALIRWAVGAAAVAGSFHAVSGATGLTVTQGSTTNKINLGTTGTVTTTNGISTGIRVFISSSQHGTAKSYRATGLPTGLTMTSTTLGVIAGIPTTTKVFTARITGYQNSNQTGDNASFNLNFAVIDGVPVITGPPQPVTVDEGQSATLSVVATGSGLTYRWIKGGVDLPLSIPGATDPALTFNPAKVADSGTYQVRVTGSGGSTVSNPALLTVNPVAVDPPTIESAPSDRTASFGSSVSFTVVAGGAGPFTYQWLKGTAPIPGQETDTLTLNPVNAQSGGTYTVRVTNAGGFAEASAVLTVAPVITATTTGPLVVHPGESVRLTVTAAGPGPLTYAWRRGGQAVTNGTTSELVLDGVQAGDAGLYTVLVSTPGASVESAQVAVEILPLLLSTPEVNGSQVRLQWTAIAGRNYRVEVSPTPAGSWRTAGTVTTAAAEAAIEVQADVDGDFFRLVPE